MNVSTIEKQGETYINTTAHTRTKHDCRCVTEILNLRQVHTQHPKTIYDTLQYNTI